MSSKNTALFIITTVLMQCYLKTSASSYYVSVNGSSQNNGSINNPWSIDYAFTNALSGDTIWVKAGNYGFKNLVVSSNNIVILGYTNLPGDLDHMQMPDSLYNYYNNNYDTIFPTLNGADRASSGIAIDFANRRSGVVIKNIQIRNYRMGISIIGRLNLVENIIASDFGDINMFYSGVGISIYGNSNILRNTFILNSAAEGIRVSGDSNLVQSSKVFCNDTLNAYEQGNPLTKYADTDYYIYVTANTSTGQGKYNIIENCYIERFPRKLAHFGHGGHGYSLTISYNHKPCDSGGGYCYDESQKNYIVENNIIRNSTSKNIDECVMLRGDKVRYNRIESVKSLSYGTLRVQNSSSYNLFEACHIMNSYYWKDPVYSTIYRNPGVDLLASYYGDSSAQNIPSPETNSYPWEQSLAAHHNTFSNCLFENVPAAVCFNSYSDFEYPGYHPLAGTAVDRIKRKKIESNSFLNCTFVALRTDSAMANVNRPSLITAMRGSFDNQFVNCIFEGFYNFESRSFALNSSQAVVSKHGIIPSFNLFDHCLFFNNAFDSQIRASAVLPAPANPPLAGGTNNQVAGNFINCIKADPLFINPDAGNFRLNPSSPCIDAAKTIAISNDFDLNPRPSGNAFDIGAFEYQFLQNIDYEIVNEINIYPNPGDSRLSFSTQYKNASYNIVVYNILGQLIRFCPKHSLSEPIDLDIEDKGLYFIILQDGKKVIKLAYVRK